MNGYFWRLPLFCRVTSNRLYFFFVEEIQNKYVNRNVKHLFARPISFWIPYVICLLSFTTTIYQIKENRLFVVLELNMVEIGCRQRLIFDSVSDTDRFSGRPNRDDCEFERVLRDGIFGEFFCFSAYHLLYRLFFFFFNILLIFTNIPDTVPRDKLHVMDKTIYSVPKRFRKFKNFGKAEKIPQRLATPKKLFK